MIIRSVSSCLVCLAIAGGVGACDRADQTSTGDSVAPPIEQTLARGEAAYIASCLVCHQHDGSGVPGFQPPLIDSAMLRGPVEALIELTLAGSEALPPDHVASDGGDYAIPMPGFPTLTDEDVAALLTYVRSTWGDRVTIAPERVAKVRERLAGE